MVQVSCYNHYCTYLCKRKTSYEFYHGTSHASAVAAWACASLTDDYIVTYGLRAVSWNFKSSKKSRTRNFLRSASTSTCVTASAKFLAPVGFSRRKFFDCARSLRVSAWLPGGSWIGRGKCSVLEWMPDNNALHDNAGPVRQHTHTHTHRQYVNYMVRRAPSL